MADTTTTHLGPTKPEVGASSDTWGAKTNANFDLLDGLFGAGGTLLVSKGGTNAGTAAGARANLGLGAGDAVSHASLTTSGNIGAGLTTGVSGALHVRAAAGFNAVYQAESAAVQVSAVNDAYSAYVAYRLRAASVEITGPTTFTQSVKYSTQSAPSGALDIGFRGAPQRLMNFTGDIIVSDAGGSIHHSDAAAHIYALYADSTYNHPIGTVITLTNGPGAGAVTIQLNQAGVALYWAGTSLTGNRTLAAPGVASLVKIAANAWLISGAGLS